MEGWIKLHRQLLDSEVFASEKGLKIWIWLLLKARYNDGFVSIRIGAGQQTIPLERGELLFGRFTAEESLSIDGSTIYKWIKKFEKMKMIAVKSSTHSTTISILKFNEYNEESSSQIATPQQYSKSTVTTPQQHGNTNKNTKKENNIENDEKAIFAQNISELNNCFLMKDETGRALKISPEQIETLLSEFIQEQKATGGLRRSFYELRKHFVAWAKKKKEKTFGKKEKSEKINIDLIDHSK